MIEDYNVYEKEFDKFILNLEKTLIDIRERSNNITNMDDNLFNQ